MSGRDIQELSEFIRTEELLQQFARGVDEFSIFHFRIQRRLDYMVCGTLQLYEEKNKNAQQKKQIPENYDYYRSRLPFMRVDSSQRETPTARTRVSSTCSSIIRADSRLINK